MSVPDAWHFIAKYRNKEAETMIEVILAKRKMILHPRKNRFYTSHLKVLFEICLIVLFTIIPEDLHQGVNNKYVSLLLLFRTEGAKN